MDSLPDILPELPTCFNIWIDYVTAKSMFSIGNKHGFDMTTQAGMNQFMAYCNPNLANMRVTDRSQRSLHLRQRQEVQEMLWQEFLNRDPGRSLQVRHGQSVMFRLRIASAIGPCNRRFTERLVSRSVRRSPISTGENPSIRRRTISRSLVLSRFNRSSRRSAMLKASSS